MTTGALYLVATPIGNLEDITQRALRVLREADLILCEDTRRTAILLNRYGISARRRSFHEHNEKAAAPELLALLRAGARVALASDAGTPLVSDPGYSLVAACAAEGIPVVPVPGASAAIAALAASGLPTDCFTFAGFLPAKAGSRRRRLEELAPLAHTLVFYEAPHRILQTLEAMVAALGPRQACLARELTKVHEEWLRGRLDEILASLRARPRVRGEITLVVAGRPETGAPPKAPEESLAEHVARLERTEGLTRKEALRSAARARGMRRRDAYQQLIGD